MRSINVPVSSPGKRPLLIFLAIHSPKLAYAPVGNLGIPDTVGLQPSSPPASLRKAGKRE